MKIKAGVDKEILVGPAVHIEKRNDIVDKGFGGNYLVGFCLLDRTWGPIDLPGQFFNAVATLIPDLSDHFSEEYAILCNNTHGHLLQITQ
jgi:hypothetical protein